MAMIICPTPDNRVERHNHIPLRGCSESVECRFDLALECLLALSRGFDQQLPIVSPDVLSQEIEAIIEMS
jgi:hypothetical protein